MDTVTSKSLVLECTVREEGTIPLANGYLTQALVLNLIKQFDPELSARLHNEPGYRPYTVFPLYGEKQSGKCILLQGDQSCRLRVTLLDSGILWRKLYTHFIEAGPVSLQLGSCTLQLVRIVSSPHADPPGWVSSTDWRTLGTLSPAEEIAKHFVTATAFSWGDRRFVVFPEPYLLWGGLLHAWNRYAPSCYRYERQGVRTPLQNVVKVTTCSRLTRALHTPTIYKRGSRAPAAIGSRRVAIEPRSSPPLLPVSSTWEPGTRRRWGWDRCASLLMTGKETLFSSMERFLTQKVTSVQRAPRSGEVSRQ